MTFPSVSILIDQASELLLESLVAIKENGVMARYARLRTGLLRTSEPAPTADGTFRRLEGLYHHM